MTRYSIIVKTKFILSVKNKGFAQQPFVAIARLGLCSEFSPKIPRGVLYL